MGQALLFPRFGYTSAGWAPPKPLGRNLDRVGEVKITTASGFNLNNATRVDSEFGKVSGLVATYFEAGAGELLIRNAGGDAFSKKGYGFAVCTRCGFATSEESAFNPKKPVPLPDKFKDHASVFSSNPNTRCWPNTTEPVLRHKVLAAKETTDIIFDSYKMKSSIWRIVRIYGNNQATAIADCGEHARLRVTNGGGGWSHLSPTGMSRLYSLPNHPYLANLAR